MHCKIVGAHFRPPAKGILSTLPVQTPLTLVPEPDNPHHDKAVMVTLDWNTVPEAARELIGYAIAGYGAEREQYDSDPDTPIHLGYIPRGEADTVFPLLAGEPLEGLFQPFPDGSPAVHFTPGAA